MPFDLLIRGGTLVDGTGSPADRPDIGVVGDRIESRRRLAPVDAGNVATVIDATGRVVTPGSSTRTALRRLGARRRRAGEPPHQGHDPALRQLRRQPGTCHRGRP
jgi:hypothetical protein